MYVADSLKVKAVVKRLTPSEVYGGLPDSKALSGIRLCCLQSNIIVIIYGLKYKCPLLEVNIPAKKCSVSGGLHP